MTGELTHAAPLSAVDEIQVTREDGGLLVRAVKNIVRDDPYLDAHFPGRTIFPGIFVLECAQQAVAQAVAGHWPGGPTRLREVKSLRFTGAMHPGEQLHVRAAVRVMGSEMARADCTCQRDDGTEVARLVLEFCAGFDEPGPAGEAGPAGEQWPVPPDDGLPAIDYGRIRSILPHGPEMVLVDQARWVTPGQELLATKAITGAELCYQQLPGGLPHDRYAYPASLIIESFGQAAVVLWQSGPQAQAIGDRLLMFAAARGCRFEAAAYPGDLLRHQVRFERSIAGSGFASGETWVGDRRIAVMASIIAVIRPATLLPADSRGPALVSGSATRA